MSLPEEHTSATETTFLLPAKNKRSRTSFWTKKPTGKSSSLFLSKHHNNTGFIKENVGTFGAKFSSRMKHIDEIYRVENFGKKLFITCTQRKWKGTDTSVSINHFLPKLYFYTQIEFTWLDETEILKLAWPAKAKRLRDPSRISLGGLKIRIGRWRYYIFDTSDTEVNHKILLLVYCIDAPSFGLLPATNRRHGAEIISQPILHLLFCCRYVPPIK